MFLIMAIYRSTESGSFVYWHAIQKDYSKYVSFVNQIIRALTRVKYWSVTQPFIYLARALPYLVTNRTVEAYKVYMEEWCIGAAYINYNIATYVDSSQRHDRFSTYNARDSFPSRILFIQAGTFCIHHG